LINLGWRQTGALHFVHHPPSSKNADAVGDKIRAVFSPEQRLCQAARQSCTPLKPIRQSARSNRFDKFMNAAD